MSQALTTSWLWRKPRRLIPAVLLGLITYITFFGDRARLRFPFLRYEPASSLKSPSEIFSIDPDASSRHHPITDLIKDSEYEHERLLRQETKGVDRAAEAYRRRRGRHPPPRFDEWVTFAESRGCLMVEEFFDRIHHDLDPFWAIDPDQIHAEIASWSNYIKIRHGVAFRSEDEQPFIGSYFDLVEKLADRLPDLDMPINYMDESRVLVPWTTMAKHMQTTQASRSQHDLTKPPRLQQFTARLEREISPAEIKLITDGPYWNLARRTCHPDTGSSTLEVDSDFSTPPMFPTTHPHGTQSGFVRNWTISQDFCVHLHLRNMHGTFVEPVTISTTLSLTPIFSGSKLLANNDILLPAAMYWADHEDFAASDTHIKWSDKRDGVFWRGTGSGGRNKVDNWTRFHRHRLVSLLNGTQMDMTLRQTEVVPHNFPLPDQELYPLVSSKLSLLVDWIRSFSDVAFYWLECFPPTRDYACSYTGSWYRRGGRVPMRRMYKYKYLPDIDGNSFSGRFRAFLMSNSLPVKATLYTEWHDSRLIPWRHFVPMDNTYVDTLSVFEFLFQYDAEAEKIAVEGRKWAERVLRKEDMLVYTYRLLLEYARVIDPNREQLGYGKDLE